jgi:hypothetical protein
MGGEFECYGGGRVAYRVLAGKTAGMKPLIRHYYR